MYNNLLILVFENENTFYKLAINNQEDIFHKKFEEAMKKIKSSLKKEKEYPIIIGKNSIKTKRKLKRTSPIDNRIVLGYVQNGNYNHITSAIKAAKDAFESWSNMNYKKRVEILANAANIISKQKFELAVFLSLENGKNRYESMADIDEAIDFIRYYCEEMLNNDGFCKIQRGADNPNEKYISRMKPYGVWAVIAPFNFPAAILIGMTIGAVITGNTVIVKPSSSTPIIGYKIIKILYEAGLPAGVINYVTGSGNNLGKAIIKSRDISGIVFTGSKEIGHMLINESNKIKPRPVIAELGGKNPTIVSDSADLEMASDGIIKAAFSYSGQKCSACSRIYVQKNIKKELIDKLIEKTKKLVVGNPLNETTDIGTVINKNAYNNYIKNIKIAARDGKILFGGKIKNNNELKYGYYVEPTIIDKLPENHELFKNELFLPILCIKEYDKFDQALKFCNDSEFGLTAGIYSEKDTEIQKFLDTIESGVVYVNRPSSSTTGAMVGRQSFGGWKNSGTTGKGSGGKHYLTQFMREQSQTIVLDKIE